MKYIIYTIFFILLSQLATAQLPANTFRSRIFTGNTEAQWTILDSPLVNPILDTFNARYPGTQIIRIQGSDTAFWFYAGNRIWKRLGNFDSTSLSNRINLKLNISDTTGRWLSQSTRLVDTVYRVNDSTIGYTIKGSARTFQILGRSPSGGSSGTVSSVGLSMPAAFSVTPSTITTSGTFNVSAAGTSAQYIKGNGTLGATDTSMIPNFFSKVRSEFSGTSPITYNTFTGAIGINNATSTGTKGAASFTSSFSDNGSGQIDLATLVSAGSCTGCTLNIDAKGRIISYADGSGGATNNVNIGAGFRAVNSITQEMRTYFGGFGIKLDSVSNANGLTWRADTTRGTGLPTKFYIDSSVSANTITVSNGLTKTGNNIKQGGVLIDAVTDIDNSGNTYFLHGTGGNVLRTVNGTFQSNISTSQISGQITASNSSTNKFSEVDAVEGSAYLVGGKNGVFYNQINADSDKVFLTTKFNTTPHKLILDTLGRIKIDAYTGTNFQTIDTSYNSLVVDGSGNVFKRSGGGGGSSNSNIGSGFRWAVPFTNNIKTVYNSNTIIWDSTSNSNGLTAKADTSVLATQYNIRLQPKVYNVISYGAVADGKERYDAAMTSGTSTLTCSSCSFTSADIGKAIRVEGAITNGDLVTTISGFTNSSTVTLGASATRTVSGDTLVFGTDNTAAIQAAINAAFLYGDAKVYIPGGLDSTGHGGFYVIAGPLITSYAGANPNAQLVWPVADLGGASFNQRKHVLIEGSNPAFNTPSAWGSDTLTAKYGSVLYSIVDGSGNMASMFGTKAPTNGYGNINYNEISFKNLNILVARNKYNGGPSVGGINGFYSSTTNVDNLLIGISGSIFKQPQPTHDVAALIIGRKDSEIYSHVRNVSAFCFKYGFVYAEDVVVDKAIAHACIFGHTIADGNYPVIGSSLDAHWCVYSLYIPNSTILGNIPIVSGVSNFSIDYLSNEIFSHTIGGSPSWLIYSKIVLDSGSRGRGTIGAWNVGEGGVGLNNSLFNKYGGDSIFTYQVGSRVDPNPHSYTNRATFNYINKLGASQNNGAEGYLYNWSPLSDASIYRIQPTVTNGSMGLYLSPSGTGASSVSPLQSWINLFNIPQWTGENTVNSSSEAFTLAAAGTRCYIATSASGGGAVRPLSLETGANTDQLKLSTDGTVSITGNGPTELSVTGSNSSRISAYFKNSNASGSTSFYCDNSRGSFAAYGGMLTGGASDATGNIFGLSRADKTFIFHDGASGLGMGIGTLNNQNLVLGTNNTERLRINAAGSIVFNNAYSFPTSNGTDGYVLTAHTGGAATWDAPTSGATTIYTGDGTANNRTVTVTGSALTFTSALTGSNSTISVTNTSSGHALIGNASGAGYGIYGIGFRGVYGNGSGGGTGVYGQETSGIGLRAVVSTGTALVLDQTPSSFNDIQTSIQISRLTSGNSGLGANGIGTQFIFAAPTTTSTSASTGGALNWSWSTATNASRTGRFAFQLVNNAGSLADKFIINGTGQLATPGYGSGTFSGTPAYTTEFDASGNVLEKPIPYSLYYSDTSATTVANTTTETSVVGNVIGSTSFNGGLLQPGSVIKLKGYGYLSTDVTPGNLTINFIVSNFTLGITLSTLLPAGVTNNDIDYEFEVTPFGLGVNQDMFYIGKIDITNNATGAVITQRFQGKGAITTTGTLATDITAKWSVANANNILNSRNNVLEVRRIQ